MNSKTEPGIKDINKITDYARSHLPKTLDHPLRMMKEVDAFAGGVSILHK